MSTVVSEAAPSASAASGSTSVGLFGRGMLFVVVGSLQFVAATVVSPVLAYTLGPSGLGLMASAIALHQVLLVLGTVGLDQALILQRAEDGDDRAARGLVALGLVLASALTLVVGLTAPLWASALGFGGEPSLVLAVVLWTVPASAVQLVLALLTGQDRLRAFAVVSLMSTVGSQAVGLALLLLVERSAEVYAWGGVVGQMAAMLLGLALVRPTTLRRGSGQVVRRALALGAPLLVSGLSLFVLNAGDRLVIQRVLGSAEAGRYQVAYVLGFTAVTVLAMTGQAWAPRITAVRSDVERWVLLTRSRDELYRLLAPTILGIVLAAPLLLRVLAPASFEPGPLVGLVLLVVLAGVPVVAGMASQRALVTVRRTRSLAVAAVAAAVVNTALNIALVPVFGLEAAAAATVVAFGVQAVVQRWALPRHLPWARPSTSSVVALLLTSAAAAASLLLPQTPLWIGLRFGGGAVCLVWLAVWLRAARRAEAAAAGAAPSGGSSEEDLVRSEAGA